MVSVDMFMVSPVALPLLPLTEVVILAAMGTEELSEELSDTGPTEFG